MESNSLEHNKYHFSLYAVILTVGRLASDLAVLPLSPATDIRKRHALLSQPKYIVFTCVVNC